MNDSDLIDSPAAVRYDVTSRVSDGHRPTDCPAMSHTPSPVAGLSEPSRRGFLYRAVTFVLGGIVAIAPLVPGVPFLLDPILRKKRRPTERPPRGKDGFLEVAKLDALPSDGSPQKFTVIDDRQDAWNFIPDQEIGSVWLRKKADGAVQCFSTVCPHLGCSVDYKANDKQFFCPCHTSAFDLDGKKLNAIPPRHMDELEIRQEPDGAILIKFKKYRGGTPEQVEVS